LASKIIVLRYAAAEMAVDRLLAQHLGQRREVCRQHRRDLQALSGRGGSPVIQARLPPDGS
jgi:hypothetical protein